MPSRVLAIADTNVDVKPAGKNIVPAGEAAVVVVSVVSRVVICFVR